MEPLMQPSSTLPLARNLSAAGPSASAAAAAAAPAHSLPSRRGSDSLSALALAHVHSPTAVTPPFLPPVMHSEFVIEGASTSTHDISSSSDDDHDDDDHDHQGIRHTGRADLPLPRSHSPASQSHWSTTSSASSFVSMESHASWAPATTVAQPSLTDAPRRTTMTINTTSAQEHSFSNSVSVAASTVPVQQPTTPTITITDPSPSKPNAKPASKSSSSSTSTRSHPHSHAHSASLSSSGTATSLSFSGPFPTIGAHPDTRRASILSTSTASHLPQQLITPSTTPHLNAAALADPAGVWRPDVARDTALALHECSIRAFALVHDAHWPMHPLPVPVPRGKPPSQTWMNPCPLVRMGTLDGTPAKFSVVWKPVRRPVSPTRALNPVNWGSHSVYVKEGQREVKVPEVTMHRRKLKPVNGEGKAKSIRSRSTSRGRSPNRSPRPVSMVMLDPNAPPIPDVPPHHTMAETSSSSSPPPNWFKRAARKVFSTSSSGSSTPTHTSPSKSPATPASMLLASAPPRTVSPSRMAALDGGDETECDDALTADADEDDATLANSTTIRAQVQVPGTPADILRLILDRPSWDPKCAGWDVVFESHFHTTRQYHFSDGIPPTQFVEVTSFKSTSIILSAMALPDLAPAHLTWPQTPPSSPSASSTHSTTHAWVPTPTSTSSLQSLTLGWVLEPCISDAGQTRVSLYVHARGPDTRGRRRKPFTRSSASIARRAATQVAGWVEQVAVRAVCAHVVREKELEGAAKRQELAAQGKTRGTTTDSGIALSLDGPGMLAALAPLPTGPGLQTATLNRHESVSRHAPGPPADRRGPRQGAQRRLVRSTSDSNLAWLARARFESFHGPSSPPSVSSPLGATGEWSIRPLDPNLVPTSPTASNHAQETAMATPVATAAALRDRAQLALVHARRLPGPIGGGKWFAESVTLLAGMMKAGWSAVTARLWWGKATHGTTMAAGQGAGEAKRGDSVSHKAGKVKIKTRGRAVSDMSGVRGPGLASRASSATSVPESTTSEVGTMNTVEESQAT